MTAKEFQQKTSLQIFLAYFKPHRRLFIMDLFCALVISLIDLAFPYISRRCMYELLPQSAYRTFFTVMAVVFAAFVLRALLTYVICYWGIPSVFWWRRTFAGTCSAICRSFPSTILTATAPGN